MLLANALGSGVLESGALLGFLPRLSRELLGEPLQLPSIATWWCGEPAAFEDAWQRPERLIVKPIERSPSEPSIVVGSLSADEREALRRRILQRPQHFVAQEWVHVSQAPVLEGTTAGEPAARLGALAARTVGLRVFAVATPSGWRVMPGGLTRVAGDEDSPVIAMQRGGRSKDTWVLADGPVNAEFSLLSTTVTVDDLVGADATLASRAAENLFWFGRYGERCDATARLLRVAIGQVLDDAGTRVGTPPAWTLAERLGIVEKSRSAARALRRAATHPEGALAQRLGSLSRVAFSLRDRMSVDHWRTLNRLIGDPALQREPALPMTLVWLDRAITSMMTLSGFVLDGMTRGIGWRFVSIGRRVERLATMCSTLQVAIDEGRAHELDWLLELADSSVTYRSRYLAAPEWLPVLDMVMRDEANPRSLAFQAKGLAEFIARLEATHGEFASATLAPAHAALRALAPGDLRPESEHLAEVIGALQRAAYAISDATSLKFFSHAVPRSMLQMASWPERHDRRRLRAALAAAPASTLQRRARDALLVSRSGLAVVAARAPDAVPRCRGSASSAHELAIEPPPDERHETRDSFGNGVTHFGVHGPHPLLRVRMLCEVEVSDRPDASARAVAGAGKRCASRFSTSRRRTACAPSRMAEPSTLVPWSDAALAYATPSFAAGRDWLDAVTDLMRRIHREFEFDAERDDGDDVGRRGARAAPRRLPGLRPRDDRLPAQPRPAGALRLRLPADAAAAGPAAPARRRRVARLGRRLFAAPRLGRVRSDQRHARRPPLHHARDRRATSPTSCRCAASSSAGAARR